MRFDEDSPEYEAEIARLDALKDTGHELDGAVRVKATFGNSQRGVFSLRIGSDELTEIIHAAKARGQNVSDFIRTVALREAREGSAQAQRRWLEPPVAEALDELVRRVEEQQREEKRRRRRPSATAGRSA